MKAKKSVWLAAIGGLAAVVLSAPAQAGACCFDDGSCQDLLGVECTTSGGSYQGDVTDCASTDCAWRCAAGAPSPRRPPRGQGPSIQRFQRHRGD